MNIVVWGVEVFMIKNIIYMTFIFNCGHALGANPLVTIQEEVNRETGGSGGSLWLLSPLVIFPFAIWLAVSDSSPMSEWAQKNKGLAYLFVTFAPCIPALLFGIGR